MSQPPPTPGRLLTAKEVADLLAVPESWVREATREGRIPTSRSAATAATSRPAIEAWLAEQHAGPKPKGRP